MNARQPERPELRYAIQIAVSHSVIKNLHEKFGLNTSTLPPLFAGNLSEHLKGSEGCVVKYDVRHEILNVTAQFISGAAIRIMRDAEGQGDIGKVEVKAPSYQTPGYRRSVAATPVMS